MTEDPALILFVCVHNAGRSRMAEAFLESIAGDRYNAVSAGTEPAERPHPEVSAAMKQRGIPLEQRAGTMLTPELAAKADRIIGMGCNVQEACPALTLDVEDWQLEDPKGQPPEVVAAIRDDIERRVRELVAGLDAATSPVV